MEVRMVPDPLLDRNCLLTRKLVFAKFALAQRNSLSTHLAHGIDRLFLGHPCSGGVGINGGVMSVIRKPQSVWLPFLAAANAVISVFARRTDNGDQPLAELFAKPEAPTRKSIFPLIPSGARLARL